MRPRPNRYADHDGPPRAIRNLDDWTQEGGRADRDLDAACDAREASDKARRNAIPDVYAVADRVLAPLLGDAATSVPRRLQQDVADNLAARGIAHPSRAQKIAETTRLLAGHRAAGDLELSLALTLAAAHLWEPVGGWKAHAPRGPHREGFTSLRHMLACAFDEPALGVGNLSLDVAQNRARTRSIEGEVFIQASHTSTGRARSAPALDRTIDAQAIVYRSAADLARVPLLFEIHVLGRYPSRDALLDELRLREARKRAAMLPARPSKGASDSELAAWRLACGVALWGEAADQMQHNRDHDGALLRAVRDAEKALKRAMGLPEKPQPSRTRSVTAAGYAGG